MLAYALAIAVGLSSSILFLTAFLMPDIHRRDDFFWSAIGLTYASILWFGAIRITGVVLLGQSAAVALLISYQWQTLKLRKAIAYPEKAAELDNFSVLKAINNLFSRRSVKTQVQPTIEREKVTEEKIAIPEETSEAVAEADKPTTEATPPAAEIIDETVAAERDSMEPTPTAVESEDELTKSTKTPSDLGVETEATEVSTASETTKTPSQKITETKQPGFFGRLFGRKKQSTPPIDTQLNEILEEEMIEEKPETVAREEPVPPSITSDTSDTETESVTVDSPNAPPEMTETSSLADSQAEREITDTEETESKSTIEAVNVTPAAEEDTDTEPSKTIEVDAEETPKENAETTVTESATENISSPEIERSPVEYEGDKPESSEPTVENLEFQADRTTEPVDNKPESSDVSEDSKSSGN
ncbi:Ycf66 family protein [Myxosarcina sp. GI1(2024)]